jgi:hypothetical protein
MTTGRRFVELDPTTGADLGEWFLDSQQTRTNYGLAGFDAQQVGPVLATGTHPRMGDPTQNVDLEIYPPNQPHIFTGPGLGGPCAVDGTTLYVYSNATQTLLLMSTTGGNQITKIPVTGLSMGDWFTDLALDGQGGAWLTRPLINGPGGAGPLFGKIDLTTGAVLFFVDPPTPSGLGGIELFAGDLWGIGADGTFRMQP